MFGVGLRKLMCIPTAEPEPCLPPIASGIPGPEASHPALDIQLSPLDHSSVLVSQTGPDGGVQPLQACTPSLVLPWNEGTPTAFGESMSLYDCTSTGQRNGDPVADCFGIITYGGQSPGAIMAVADGVGWGEPSRRAARCAILGALNHLHTVMGSLAKENQADPASKLMSSTIFDHMLQAIHAAQALILRQMGSLTTLVVSIIQPQSPSCPHFSPKGPLKKSGSKKKLHVNASSGGGTCAGYDSWAVMTLTVGDSSAWVWRAQQQVVEELTAASHQGEVRNARFTPGALGLASLQDPDLTNLTLSVTLTRPGDIVFLGSDGIADNFNPHMLQLSRPATVDTQMHNSDDDEDECCASLPPALNPSQVQDKHVELLTEAIMAVCSRSGSSNVGQSSCSIGQATGAPKTPSSGKANDFVCPPCTARDLVKGLLAHVNEVTEPLRQATAEKARAAETKGNHSRDLGTDAPKMSKMPPGKLDHATVVAYQLGARRTSDA